MSIHTKVYARLERVEKENAHFRRALDSIWHAALITGKTEEEKLRIIREEVRKALYPEQAKEE